MLATIHTVFVNENIHFVDSHHESQDRCILRGVLWQKPVTPQDPPKYPTVGGGGKNEKEIMRDIWEGGIEGPGVESFDMGVLPVTSDLIIWNFQNKNTI